MKITKTRLKQIIKEELEQMLESSLFGPDSLLQQPKIKRLPPMEDEPEYKDSRDDLSTIGINYGEEPTPRSDRRLRRRLNREINPERFSNRKVDNPKHIEAYNILKDAGFVGYSRRDQKISLKKSKQQRRPPSPESRFNEFDRNYAAAVLDQAAEAGRISFDVARQVSMEIERDEMDLRI